MAAQTLYDKLWQDHVVVEQEGGTCLLYIDRHLIHEVTSPQAFEGLKLSGRNLWRADSIMATADHNTPTEYGKQAIVDPVSSLQIETLDQNVRSFGVPLYYPFKHLKQGIVHVVGPENGLVLPGMTVVCGDSHTATHGAFACLAHGIGTSEVEHVMATQCLLQKKSKSMRITVNNCLAQGVYAKDLVLAIIGQIGTAGGTGYAIEFAGQAIRHLTMEGRMTICNMAIEAGARCGIIAVDQITLDYVKNRTFAPKSEQWDLAEQYWRTLCSDIDAKFDKEIQIDASTIQPQVTWGTSPEMVSPVNGAVPDPNDIEDELQRNNVLRALEYMDLKPKTPIEQIPIDQVFIGSCTNSRIEDLRQAASIVQGKQKSPTVKRAMVVPGSGLVKKQAEQEGLDQIFLAAGFEWRAPGCSMCLAMNADRLGPGEHSASTSNRNFEGRQGIGGRTHLVSPAMAAAAAIYGCFVDVSTL